MWFKDNYLKDAIFSHIKNGYNSAIIRCGHLETNPDGFAPQISLKGGRLHIQKVTCTL